MKKIKFAVCILLIISTILTFSLPLVADESGEGTKDTVKKDDSFYLSEETLEKIGPFKKIKVDKDTKYLTIYRGFVHDLTVVSIDEFISMFDGVESIYGSYDDLPDLMNNDESKGYYEGDEWKINRQKFIIAYSSNGRFETKTFDLNFTDGSLYESTNGSSTYENYVNELIGKNEYIPEKVISAASNDSIIKCIDSEIEVSDVYVIESLTTPELFGYSVYFKTDKGDYIYFYHETINKGDYLFPADDLPRMLFSAKDIVKGYVWCDFSDAWPAEIIDRYDVNSENFFAKTGWKNDFSWVKVDEPVNTDDTQPTDTSVGVDTDNNQPTAINTVPVETDVQKSNDNHPIILIAAIALLAVALAALVIGASSKRKNK